MKIPHDFAKQGEIRVCKLRKSLYGLRKASRNWYHKFIEALVQVGSRQSRADHSLFIHKRNDSYIATLIYADDVILVGKNDGKIFCVKTHLNE